MSRNIFQKGFILAGLVNILGVLTFTRFFTNEVVFNTDPWVMSSFGMGMILVWGLAYMAVAKGYDKVPWLVGVFIIEKLVYVLAWANWMSQNDLSSVYQQDIMAGIFYAIYGLNDLLFMTFFGYVFYLLRSGKNPE